MLKNLFSNWRTSSAGLIMIVGSVVHLIFAARAGTATEGVWTASLTAIVGGIGLIFAGDASKSVTKTDAVKPGLIDAVKPEAMAQNKP